MTATATKPSVCRQCGRTPLIGHGSRTVSCPALVDGAIQHNDTAIRRYRCPDCGSVEEADGHLVAAKAAARAFVAASVLRIGLDRTAKIAGVTPQTCIRWIRHWLKDSRIETPTPSNLGIMTLSNAGSILLFDVDSTSPIDADHVSRLPKMLSDLDGAQVENVCLDFNATVLQDAESLLPRTTRTIPGDVAGRRLDAILRDLRAAYPCPEVKTLVRDVAAHGWTPSSLIMLQHHLHVCGEGMRRNSLFVKFWKSEILAGMRSALPWPEVVLTGAPHLRMAIAMTLVRQSGNPDPLSRMRDLLALPTPKPLPNHDLPMPPSKAISSS